MKKLLVLRTAKAHQKQHESTLDTPPAITIASGGQNSPPVNSNSGMKPATVVSVVETMCRVAASVSSTIAAASPRRAPRIGANRRQHHDAAVDGDTDQTALPMIGLKPSG